MIAYQMIIRMCIRAPMNLVCALTMAFMINHELSLIFVGAMGFLIIVLGFIMITATRYFNQVFPKYDDLNESVQENVVAIRVVKSFVREKYENEKFPISLPDPIEAIKFRMEQMGYNQNDLANIVGLKSRASEILNRKRKLSLEMIRQLHERLHIPTDVLIQTY